MSSCEEIDDEDKLDNGKDGGPQQEEMDQGMLGMLWHRQSRQQCSALPEPGESRTTDVMR